MSEFNHVELHQHLQVINNPPANEVAIFHFSSLENTEGIQTCFISSAAADRNTIENVP